MGTINSVLLAGAGAIGSMLAWQIQEARPKCLSILAGASRKENYEKTGFEINGEKVFFPCLTPEDTSHSDLISLACKNHHLEQGIKDIKNHVGPQTLIISLLNGISSEERLAEAFGAWRLPLAMIVGTDAVYKQGINTFSAKGTICFGDPEPLREVSENVASIAAFFDSCNIRYEIPADMRNRLWYKFMMNVGLNQTSALLQLPYKAFKSTQPIPEAKALMEGAMREVQSLAKAKNIELSDSDIEKVWATIDTLSDEGKTSMCQDVEARRKTEIELFSGEVLKLSKILGIPCPVNQVLWLALRAKEQSYTA